MPKNNLEERPFLFKEGQLIRQSKKLDASFPVKLKPTGETVLGFPFAKEAGYYRNRIWIHLDGAHLALDATADMIKKKIRRIRQDEAIELDDIDAQLLALHERRGEVLHRAWEKAHVVTLKELVDMAEDKLGKGPIRPGDKTLEVKDESEIS